MTQRNTHDQSVAVGMLMGVLRFLDLDTKEKGLMALIEVVPTVGLWYALIGYRVKISRNEALSLEKITLLQRGYYLAGEFLVSGHILSGISSSIRRKGMAKVRNELGLAFVRRVQEVATRRALEGAKRFADNLDVHR